MSAEDERAEDVSRRAVLGAALGAPLLDAPLLETGAAPPGPGLPPAPSVPPSTSPSRLASAWGRRLAAYRAAAGELGAYEALCSGRPFEEQSALEGGFDARSDAMYSALRRLLRAPAPDVAALAAKLDLAVEHEVGTLTGGEACMAAIRRDAHRLSGARA